METSLQEDAGRLRQNAAPGDIERQRDQRAFGLMDLEQPVQDWSEIHGYLAHKGRIF